ncbi:hypothetical protein F5879DRAFT_994907 [Lentinula edodes]|nr:hypothetical protein F5879DRAFT_994907 [Lentinula edodes]
MSQSQSDFPKDQTIDPNSTVQTEGEYDLEPLKSLDIGHGIHRYVLNPKRDEIKKALTLLPTLRPFYKIANNQNIRQRRDNALRIAAVGLKRAELSRLMPPPRKLFKSVFPKELSALDTLLFQHITGTPASGQFVSESAVESDPVQTVHTLDSQGYIQLNYALLQLQQAAKSSFRLTGKRLPDLPYWGNFGKVGLEFYTENDFEIIAIAYRAQVEHFLTRLADVHDFKTNELRNDSELAEEHIRLFGEIVEAANQDIPLPMESISNAVRQHRTKCVTSTKAATANSYSGIGSSRITSLPPRSTCRLQDVFPVFNFGKNVAEAPDPGNDSSSNEDDSEDERPSRSPPRLKRQIPVATSIGAGWSKEQFDMRLKQDTVPTWDGDTNTIVRWIKRVNDLAKKSRKLCKQLGSIVPRRLEGSAQY